MINVFFKNLISGAQDRLLACVLLVTPAFSFESVVLTVSPQTRLSLLGKIQSTDSGQDEDAWLEFVQIYQPLIHAFVLRRGLQHADATDVTQEVLRRVAVTIRDFDFDSRRGSFRGWLYQMTRNLTVDHLRRNRRFPSADEPIDLEQLPQPSSSDSRAFRIEYERQLFQWAARKVKPAFSEANWLAFRKTAMEQGSVEDVAREIGISKGKIYVARSRIMARIADVIRRRLEDTDSGERL